MISFQMRKHLTRTKLFMNGGFVTLPDMVAAVRDGWAAGISLARPVAAEPGFISFYCICLKISIQLPAVINWLNFNTKITALIKN